MFVLEYKSVMPKLITIKPGQTKVFPVNAIVTVALASFMDFFCGYLVLPNLPFAVQSFYPGLSEKEVGFYYGYIVSAYFFGGIFGSLFWGWFADTFGRRFSMICCLVLQTITCILFGFSQNFATAIVIRSFWGFTNGNQGVIKTYVSEVCSEDMQSMGFSVIVTSCGVASVAGPSIGGILGDVKSSFPWLVIRFPFLKNFPLLLPCVVGFVISVIVLSTIICCAPETLTREMVKENESKRQKTKQVYLTLKSRIKSDKLYTPTVDERYIIEMNSASYLSLIKKHDVFLTCCIFGSYALIQAGQDVLYPVWLINSIENNGFDFSSSDLGWMFTGLSPVQLFSTPLIYPYLTNLMTYKQINFVTGLLFSCTLLISPSIALYNSQPVPIRWVLILLSYGLSMSIRFFYTTNIMVLVTNSTYQDFRAKVNGLGQVMSAIGRLIGPSITSNIFAFVTNRSYGFPFDYGFAFYFLAILQFAFSFLTCYLPESINFRKPTLQEYVEEDRKSRTEMTIEMVSLKKETTKNCEVDTPIIAPIDVKE